MTFEKEFVEKKLALLKGYQNEIEEYFQYTDKEILSDTKKLHIGERLLQLVVDTIIDINEHFIKELHLPTTDDFQGTFLILTENAILPKDFSERIAPVVGLRNRIVHRYESVDKKIFIESFRKNFQDFEEYMEYIHAYLQKNP